jgi:hypothetical protein
MATKTVAGSTLTRRALNRALLGRQLLLRRAAIPVAAAIEHLVGMQSQVPHAPYPGLWSRLDGFRPEELSTLLANRGVVRMSLMRSTLHLVTADDAFAIRPVMQDVLERHWRSSAFARAVDGIDRHELLRYARSLLAESPLGGAELARRLADRWPDHDPMSLSYAVHFLEPIVQLPPRGIWGQTGRPVNTTVEAWLGRPMPVEASIESIVLRYLAAFGPASVADMRAWSYRAGLRGVFEGLRPRLVTFRDERGREHFDLPDAPRPDPDTPAPVRFVPDYDNLGLSHGDRSRVIDDAFRPLSASLASEYRAFLVDGFVAGTWKHKAEPGAATLMVTPYRPLSSAEESEVGEEATRLLDFLAGDTPARRVVFSR